jgi:hypothetical protein
MKLETAISEDSPESSNILHQLSDKIDIPPDALMTLKQVAQILGITEHCLTSNRKNWKEILPRIQFNGRLIRYRKSDVLKLIAEGHLLSLGKPQETKESNA